MRVVHRYVRFGWILLCLFTLGACDPRVACAPRASPPPVRSYDLLSSFERARLEAFASREELARYLDSLCYVQDLELDAPGSPARPTLPEHPPSRERSVWADSQQDVLSWRGVVGTSTYGPLSEQPPRLVRHGARVYSLHGDRLRSFDLGAGEASLRAGPELLLNPAAPSEAEQPASAVDASQRRRQLERKLRGVAVFDYLFAHQDELVVIGARQDRWAIEIVRIGIGERGELRRKSSHLLHLLPREVDGFGARLSDGALVIYFRHRAVYDGSAAGRPASWSLPALEEEGTARAPRPLLSGRDVYHPLGHAEETYLHVLVRCDLRLPGLACGAQALPGPDAHASYVAADALYLWLVAWRGEAPDAGSIIVRMPFARSRPFGALRVRGHSPSHGLSPTLLEHGGALFAIVANDDSGPIGLLHAPVGRFDAAVTELAHDGYRSIEGAHLAKLEPRHVRLVGRYLVWGREGHRSGYMMRYGPLVPNVELVSLADGTRATLPLAHTATYLHEFGEEVVVVGTDGWNVHVSMIGVRDGAGKVLAHYVLRDAVPKLEGHGGAPPLYTAGARRWLALDISPLRDGVHPQLATRVPLRWTPPSTELVPANLWTAPYDGLRRMQADDDEWLELDGARLLVRMENQLMLYRVAEELVLEQRLEL